MMIAAGTVILLIDTYLSTMIIIKTATREIVIRRVIPGKDPLHLATAKTIGNGITTSKTTGTIVTERNTENWMTTGVASTGQVWKEV